MRTPLTSVSTSVSQATTLAVRPLWRLLRPHQWVKNVLVLVPVVLAHRWSSNQILADALVGMLAFTLCASATYVLNDLKDRHTDRLNPSRRSRPLADGSFPIRLAMPLAVLLGAAGLVVAALCTPRLAALLALYLLLNQAYTHFIKQLVLLDVLALVLFYMLRIQAGGLATGIVVSGWLLAFAACLFLSLALAKRSAELSRLVKGTPATSLPGRSYRARDRGWVHCTGLVTGVGSIVVLAAYSFSPAMTALYSTPWPLLLICAVLLSWLLRTWHLAITGRLHDDPVVFVTRDPASYLAGLVCIVLLVWASSATIS
jgi:4-hydroxybenzoate polyprenyltransferase